jgi:succinate-acetate transporter protein
MKLNLPTVSKAYLLLVSLINFNHVISMLGLTETLVNAPPYLSFWWWHVILVLVYGMLPISAVLVNNEKSFLIVTGVFIAGIFTESFGVFTMIVDARLIFLLLDTLAVAFSLVLAVENASLKMAAERLSFERSQF